MSGSLWGRRRARAIRLLREAPHAEELLVFYAELAEIQERVAERVPVDEWSAVARRHADEGEGGPPLSVARLDAAELLPLFRDFLGQLPAAGTEVIAAGAHELLAHEDRARAALAAGPERFHARAFLEAVMTPLAAHLAPNDRRGPAGRCPSCGSWPVVGALQDLPDAQGARTLHCALCATEWRANRLGCARCGETSAERLLLHRADSVPHVRVEECRSCHRYMKTVDLRERGDAVPVVDELAAVELDLWARERGLSKLRENVLEL